MSLEKIRVKPFILAFSLLSTIFSFLEVSHCNFFMLREENNNQESYKAYGFFRKMLYDSEGSELGCIENVDSLDFGPRFTAGKAFGTTTSIFTSAAFILLSITLIANPKNTLLCWNLSRGFLVAASISQILTFITLGNTQCASNNCYISGVGVLAVFNTFLLIALSMITFRESIPDHPWLVWYELPQDPSHDNELSRDRVCDSGGPPERVTDETEIENGTYLENMNGPNQCVDPGTSSLPRNCHPDNAVRHFNPRTNKIFRLVFVGVFLLIWCISLFGVQRCSFMLLGKAGTGRSDYTGLGLFSRGLYSHGNLVGCIRYTDSMKREFDSAFRTGRVFGVITTWITSSLVILSTLQLFVRRGQTIIWNTTILLLPVAIFSLLMTFVSFKSEMCSATNGGDDCALGGASILSILNVLIMLAITALACAMEAPSTPLFLLWNEKKSSIESKIPSERVIDMMRRKLRTLCNKDYYDDETSANTCDEVIIHRSILNQKQSSYEGFYESARFISSQSLSVRIEFSGNEKKTIKEVTNPDGSKTVTTMIEEIEDGGSDSDAEENGEECLTDDLDSNASKGDVSFGSTACSTNTK